MQDLILKLILQKNKSGYNRIIAKSAFLNSQFSDENNFLKDINYNLIVINNSISNGIEFNINKIQLNQ